jgi:hypothetical protein
MYTEGRRPAAGGKIVSGPDHIFCVSAQVTSRRE